MKQKLLNLTRLRSLMLLACMMLGMSAWGEDVTFTINIGSFTDLPSGTAAYDTYDWSQGGISGKATIYANASSTSLQFNATNKYFYSTSAVPGTIKSIKMTTASGTNRTYDVYGSTSPYSGSGEEYGTKIGSQTVTTSGTTFTVVSGSYTYFTIVKSGSGAGYLSSIEVTYTTGGSTPTLEESDLALPNAPVALTFDLYSNKNAQTINFTTSSTGAVTVSESEYVTTSVSGNTITVTPVKKTTSAQEITVSQAADNNYQAGSVTFTVSISDSTPTETITFVAGTDLGSTSASGSSDAMTKSVITISCTDAAFATTEYRMYKNSKTTFSTTQGRITRIEFTGVESNPISRFNTIEGLETVGKDGTWTGQAASITFTAGGGQVRASRIVITVSFPNGMAEHTGTADDPFTVADVIEEYASGTDVYVKGYIVGSFNSSSSFTNEAASNTNLALADLPNETTNVIPVELPSALRNAWGSKAYNIGIAQVVVKATPQTYFSRNGLKSTSQINKVAEYISITDAGYATYYTDCALDFTGTGITASTATYNNDATKLIFTQHNVVPTNTGVLLHKAGGGSVNVPVAEAATAITDNCFVGTLTDIASLATADGNYKNYILNNKDGNVGFYWANGQKVGAHRAYAHVLTPNSGSTQSFISINPGEESGIENVSNSATEDNVYDLQGRRVAQPQKGLYIVNGKKVIIK